MSASPLQDNLIQNYIFEVIIALDQGYIQQDGTVIFVIAKRFIGYLGYMQLLW